MSAYPKEHDMKAYVLITAEVGAVSDAQERLRATGITQVDAVAGSYDLVAVLEADDATGIGRTVLGDIQRTEGVLSTVNLLQIG
jgi:hypothetical protein